MDFNLAGSTLFSNWIAWREQLLAPSSFAVALLVAVAFHMWEVGHNVFKAW
jgi:glucose dehydrogenase